MILYPQDYLENVREITIEYLKQKKIKALILDVDNTLIDFNKKMEEGTEKWCYNLKKNGITMYILSNTNKKEKVEKLAKSLGLPYKYFAKKPLKGGFLHAKKEIEKIRGEKLENNEIGVVGDQIMTDIIGANHAKMFAILVKPISKKDIWVTKIKRPIEDFIINSYEKGRK